MGGVLLLPASEKVPAGRVDVADVVDLEPQLSAEGDRLQRRGQLGERHEGGRPVEVELHPALGVVLEPSLKVGILAAVVLVPGALNVIPTASWPGCWSMRG